MGGRYAADAKEAMEIMHGGRQHGQASWEVVLGKEEVCWPLAHLHSISLYTDSSRGRISNF